MKREEEGEHGGEVFADAEEPAPALGQYISYCLPCGSQGKKNKLQLFGLKLNLKKRGFVEEMIPHEAVW